MKINKYGYGGEFLSAGIGGASTGAQIGSMFGPLGTGIGAGVGFLGMGLAGALGAKKADKIQASADDQINAQTQQILAAIKAQTDQIKLNGYSSSGDRNFSYFGAYGTKLPMKATGGELTDTGEGQMVQGPSHENGGVNLSTQNGTPFAQVEGDEFIVDDMVFSRRLPTPNGGTFADAAYMLSETPEYKKFVTSRDAAKDRKKSIDLITSRSGERELDGLSNPMEMLFQLQDIAKQQMMAQQEQQPQGEEGGEQPEMGKYGMKLAYGGSINPTYGNFGGVKRGVGVDSSGPSGLSNLLSKIGSGLSNIDSEEVSGVTDSLAPFVDNIFNSKLINKTPEIPIPTMTPFVPMKTRYNNNAELREITSLTNSANRAVDNTYATGAAADNRKRANLALAIGAKGKSFQNKENIETQLFNQNVGALQNNINGNIGLLNNYKDKNFMRSMDILASRSANVSNATDDVKQGIVDRKLDARDIQTLEILREKYSTDGVFNRDTPEDIKKLLKQFNKRK